MRNIKSIKTFAALCALLSAPALQAANPAQQSVSSQPGSSMPVYRVTVVARTAKAINYQHRSGATKIDFHGTELLANARGEAKVESKQGYIEIEVEFDDLQPASKFGNPSKVRVTASN